MVTLILATIMITALAGLLIKWILEAQNREARITWREYAIGMAVSPIAAVLVAWVGWTMARDSKLKFMEYWNGWEVAAVKEYVECTRDGPCRYEYDCDPYIVMVAYDCMCTTDKNGYTSCSTCYRPETRYHSCPYVDREYNFYADTTLGRYTIATNVFPENPQAHQWRAGTPIPQNVISSAGTGEPPFWVAVRARCEANRPGPVTARRSYVNYILASEHTLMKESSGDILDYQSRKLLPMLFRTVQSFYRADKVYFVGWLPQDGRAWQEALEYLNANLGSQMQGDLHLVVVKDEAVSRNPDRYVFALKAHWQDKSIYGSDALSKNGIVVLVGTADGATVSWSRAFTGMPLGNEKFIVMMRDGLKGLPLTAATLLGPPASRKDAKGIHYPPDGAYGPIQRVLWGADNPATKFKRVSMSGDDGQGGFLYLKNEIRPSTGQMWTIFIFTLFICCGAWLWAATHHDPSERT
ncbi:MAG: hypothetical protein Q7S09_03980 [bacterium]|nr:hypothetical protein [bacterium]